MPNSNKDKSCDEQPDDRVFDPDNDVGRAIDDKRLEDRVQSDRFKNRRRMAWTALIAILVVMGCLMFAVTETRIEKLETPIVWFFMGMTTIVGTYMGVATYAYVMSDKLKAGK